MKIEVVTRTMKMRHIIQIQNDNNLRSAPRAARARIRVELKESSHTQELKQENQTQEWPNNTADNEAQTILATARMESIWAKYRYFLPLRKEHIN